MVQKSAMKLGAILVFCILLSSHVLAIDITLGLGESYIRNGANITFAKLDFKNDKVVLCVNNQKQILEEDQLAYFTNENGTNIIELEIDYVDIKDRTIDIDIGWVNVCDDVYCECVGDCLNDECKIQMYDEWGNPIAKSEESSEVEEEVNESVKKVEEPKGTNYAFVVGLGVIGSLIGIGLVWLFWFRQVTF